MKGEAEDMMRYVFNCATHGTEKRHITEEIILNYMERNMKLLTSPECQQFLVNRTYLSARSMILGLGHTVDDGMNERLKTMVRDKVGFALRELKSKQAATAKATIAMLSAFQQSPGDKISYGVFARWASSNPQFLSALKPSDLAMKLLVSACSGAPSDAASVTNTCTKFSTRLDPPKQEK